MIGMLAGQLAAGTRVGVHAVDAGLPSGYQSCRAAQVRLPAHTNQRRLARCLAGNGNLNGNVCRPGNCAAAGQRASKEKKGVAAKAPSFAELLRWVLGLGAVASACGCPCGASLPVLSCSSPAIKRCPGPTNF